MASELKKNLQRQIPEFEKALLLCHVKQLASYLYSKSHISTEEWRAITEFKSVQEARNALLQYVLAATDDAVKCLEEALRNIEKHELADKLCSNGQADQNGATRHPVQCQEPQQESAPQTEEPESAPQTAEPALQLNRPLHEDEVDEGSQESLR